MTINEGGAQPPAWDDEADADVAVAELRRAFPNIPWKRVETSAVASFGPMCIRVCRPRAPLPDCRPQTWTAEASHNYGDNLPLMTSGTAAAAARMALNSLRRELDAWVSQVELAMSGRRQKR